MDKQFPNHRQVPQVDENLIQHGGLVFTKVYSIAQVATLKISIF